MRRLRGQADLIRLLVLLGRASLLTHSRLPCLSTRETSTLPFPWEVLPFRTLVRSLAGLRGVIICKAPMSLAMTCQVSPLLTTSLAGIELVISVCLCSERHISLFHKQLNMRIRFANVLQPLLVQNPKATVMLQFFLLATVVAPGIMCDMPCLARLATPVK